MFLVTTNTQAMAPDAAAAVLDEATVRQHNAEHTGFTQSGGSSRACLLHSPLGVYALSATQMHSAAVSSPMSLDVAAIALGFVLC